MKKEPVLSKTFFLSAGEANAEQEMSIPVLVSKFIDIATLHANQLGIGNATMAAEHSGWVLTRLTLEMMNYPKVNENYTVSTWIEDFNRHFSTRCFKVLKENGEEAGFARTIWMVLDTENHSHVSLSRFNLDSNLILGEDVPIKPQAKHYSITIGKDPHSQGSAALVATHPPYPYTFQYCDLDGYRHVNTVRYISLLLNIFSLQQHDKTQLKRLEISFMHEAVCGMPTVILRADDPENELFSSFELQNEIDANPIMFARILRENR